MKACPAATPFRNRVRLEQTILGVEFQNPLLLASGTCGYVQEFERMFDLEALGGYVTKAVTVEERAGNPAPRVSEFAAGMMNSVGLANVGLEKFRSDKLPWLAQHLQRPRVIVNVAGRTAAEYGEVVAALDDSAGFVAFELNVSCPNVREGGAVFCSRADLLTEAVAAARKATSRPLIVKLAPNIPDIGAMAAVAVDAGADALTLVNTMPGLLFDVHARTPTLGAGTGGVSGPALLPIGVNAVYQARRRVRVPILGVGGVRTAEDVVQYLLAGASLVQIGTATFADPAAGVRVLRDLERYGRKAGVGHVSELIGAGRLA